jgi:hypothetical protein
MTTTRTMIALAMSFAASTVASASVDFGDAPEGYSPLITLSGVDGSPNNPSRWFDDEQTGSIRTNWRNEKITFNTGELARDSYMIGITVRNGGNLPLKDNYDNFKVDVTLNGQTIASKAPITASDTEWNTRWFDAGELSGDASLTLKWRNDSYRKGVYDANITYGAVTFAGQSIPAPSAAGLACVGLASLTRRRR